MRMRVLQFIRGPQIRAAAAMRRAAQLHAELQAHMTKANQQKEDAAAAHVRESGAGAVGFPKFEELLKPPPPLVNLSTRDRLTSVM